MTPPHTHTIPTKKNFKKAELFKKAFMELARGGHVDRPLAVKML